MSTILLAIDDEALCKEFADTIKETPEFEKHSVLRVPSFKAVTDSLEDLRDVALIVIDYNLKSGMPGEPGDEHNLPVELAKNLDAGKGTRCLILGPVVKAADRRDVELCERVATINTTDFLEPTDQPGWFFGTAKIARMLAAAAAEAPALAPSPAPDQGGGVIDLVIGKHKTMSCTTYQIECGRFIPLHTVDPFEIDGGILQDMLDFTQNLADENKLSEETFLNNYRSIGRKARALLHKDSKTCDAIRDLIAKVGGIDKIWVRFQMPYNDLPVTPFEAILQCDSDDDQHDDFQVSFSPVYRILRGANRIGVDIRTPVLSQHIYRNPERISCLVINASTAGPVDPMDDIDFPKLREIKSAAAETSKVVEIFEEMHQAGLVSAIDSIRFDSDAEKQDPRAALRQKLTSRKWDIVHYNGHSYFTEAGGEGRGYVFLPGDGLVKAVRIAELADWCAETDFVFMSSCQSATPGFIHSLASKGIPMIVGYRWRVSDGGAACFAERFYRALFQDKRIGSIEGAFFAAQKCLKGNDADALPPDLRDRTVWARSMLVLQNV